MFQNTAEIMAYNTKEHPEILKRGQEAIARQAMHDMYSWRNCFGRRGWFPTFEESVDKVIDHSLKMAEYLEPSRINFLLHVARGEGGYTRDDAIGLSGYLYEDDPYSDIPEYKLRDSGWQLLYALFVNIRP